VIKRASFLSLILCVLLVACSRVVATRPTPIYLGNQAAFELLPPSDRASDLNQTQRIVGKASGREFALNALVEVNAKRIWIAFLSDFGNEIGEVLYERGAIEARFSAPSAEIKPEYLIADFQLCFYDVEALENSLEKIGLTLRVTNGENERREILNGDRLLIVINKMPRNVVYRNLLRNYQYEITWDE
jgi:hypothetical protein